MADMRLRDAVMPDPDAPADQAEEDARRSRMVEDALFRRACGYEIPLKKVFKLKHAAYDESTGKKISEWEELAVGEEEEHVPADVRVCAYYLNNRSPARWQEHPSAALGDDPGDGVVAFPELAPATPPPVDTGGRT